MAKTKKTQFATKTEYEVRVVFQDGKRTMSMPVAKGFDDAKDAQTEARNLHRETKKHYKVTQVTHEDIYEIY